MEKRPQEVYHSDESKEQYSELRKEFRKYVSDYIREEDFAHLRPPTRKGRSEYLDLKSKFRFNIFPFDSFEGGNGQRNFSFSPLEILFFVYGSFNNPRDISRGLTPNQDIPFRIGIGLNAVFDSKDLTKGILGGINTRKTGIIYALQDGNYRGVVELVAPVINDRIHQFKEDYYDILSKSISFSK